MESVFVRYLPLVCFHKLTRSQSLARSFCENKLVRKYRPSALSMKKSIFVIYILRNTHQKAMS